MRHFLLTSACACVLVGCVTSPKAQALLDANHQQRTALMEQREELTAQLEEMRALNDALQGQIEEGTKVETAVLDQASAAVAGLTDGLAQVQEHLEELDASDTTITATDKQDQTLWWAQLAGAVLGAGGLGALGSRFGPSRSKKAVEEMELRVDWAEEEANKAAEFAQAILDSVKAGMATAPAPEE